MRLLRPPAVGYWWRVEWRGRSAVRAMRQAILPRPVAWDARRSDRGLARHRPQAPGWLRASSRRRREVAVRQRIPLSEWVFWLQRLAFRFCYVPVRRFRG